MEINRKSSETIQKLSNTAIADFNRFCIEFYRLINASVAQKNQLEVFRKIKHLEIIEENNECSPTIKSMTKLTFIKRNFYKEKEGLNCSFK